MSPGDPDNISMRVLQDQWLLQYKNPKAVLILLDPADTKSVKTFQLNDDGIH